MYPDDACISFKGSDRENADSPSEQSAKTFTIDIPGLEAPEIVLKIPEVQIGIKVYPNPDRLYIDFGRESPRKHSGDLLSITGAVILSKFYGGTDTSELSLQSPGNY